MLYKNVSLHLLFIIPLLCHSFFARAQQDDEKQYISLSHENDMLGGNSDRYYTSGARLTWFSSRFNAPPGINIIANHIPAFDLNEKTHAFFTLGQNLYTPENINLRLQPSDDRPWAAFLYGSVGLATPYYQKNNKLSHIDEMEFTAGIIGPEALGEQTQKFVHKHISNSPIPKGWDNQLAFEPGIILSWQRRFPFKWERQINPRLNTRIEPNMSVCLGNIRTNIGIGATAIIGSERLLDTPARVRPAIPGTGIFLSQNNKFNWQFFAGIDARAVARDIFLDGNSFSNTHSVDKEHFVGDLSAGASIFYGDYRLSYTLNLRSKEFKDQREESIFGSITLTKRF